MGSEQLQEQYYEMFGESLPTFQICRGRTDAEIDAILRECIEKGKDVYELGYCTLNEDVQY
jgi:hypothetical protein